MNCRRLLVVACAALLMPCGSFAQKPERIRRVGFLMTRSRPANLAETTMTVFAPALAELGYIEGKNLVLEWRWGGGDYSRLPALAEELVRLPVDVIVTDGTPGIRAAQGATKTIPIVFSGGADVVAQGFVQSLAHPGGNTTGVPSC